MRNNDLQNSCTAVFPYRTGMWGAFAMNGPGPYQVSKNFPTGRTDAAVVRIDLLDADRMSVSNQLVNVNSLQLCSHRCQLVLNGKVIYAQNLFARSVHVLATPQPLLLDS